MTENIVNLPTAVAPAEDGLAPLPVHYRRAVAAIEAADTLDECREWANRGEALRSYARQARDERLIASAQRIRARATRRAGELLAEIEPGRPGPKPELGMVDHTELSRVSAAREAGMSKHQQVQATRLAAIPPAQFEAMVERERPATITELAEVGRQPRPSPPPSDDLTEEDARQIVGHVARRLNFDLIAPDDITHADLVVLRLAVRAAPPDQLAALRRARRFLDLLEV